jgi:hypothetical protein
MREPKIQTWHAAAAFGLIAMVVAPASAQRAPSPDRRFDAKVLTISAWVGGAAYTDFRQGEARIGGSGGAADSDRRLSAETSVAFSAAAGYWPSSWWGVRLHGSYSPTRFALAFAGTEHAPVPVAASDEPRLARLDVWLYDVDVVFRAPVVFGRVAPYGVIGAGRVEYRAHASDGEIPAEASTAFAAGARADWAGMVGLGAMIPLDDRDLMLSFEVTDHITRTPIGKLAMGSSSGADRSMELNPDGTDGGDGLLSNLRLNVGLTLPIRLAR